MGKPVVIEEFGKALGKIQAWLCLPKIITSNTCIALPCISPHVVTLTFG